MNTINRGQLFDLDRIFRHQTPSYRYLNAKDKSASRGIEKMRVDINDMGETYELIAELPGVEKSNIFVTVEESDLVIETKTAAPENKENESLSIRRERFSGNYKRSFNLGDDIDHESIKAQFKDGLLILQISKKKEVIPQPTTIEVH